MRNTTLFALLCVVATGLLAVLACHLALADGSGSAALVLVDPTSNPAGFLNELVTFAHQNWELAAGAALYGSLRIAAYLGKGVAALAWLGAGRVAIVIAGGSTVLGTGIQSYLSGGSLQAAFVAAVVALGVYYHPAASAVAASQAKA
jgi:hypothetical protein